MDVQRIVNRRNQAQQTARFLGWFSIGLGVAEIFAARPMARMLGMHGSEGLLRLYGMREVATGMGIFASRDKGPWLWGRVAGDALDMATLASCFEDNPRKGALMAAVAAVAGVAALDFMTAQRLTTDRRLSREPIRDYSDRTGYPLGIENSRGAAAKDFHMPADMRSGMQAPPPHAH